MYEVSVWGKPLCESLLGNVLGVGLTLGVLGGGGEILFPQRALPSRRQLFQTGAVTNTRQPDLMPQAPGHIWVLR